MFIFSGCVKQRYTRDIIVYCLCVWSVN